MVHWRESGSFLLGESSQCSQFVNDCTAQHMPITSVAQQLGRELQRPDPNAVQALFQTMHNLVLTDRPIPSLLLWLHAILANDGFEPLKLCSSAISSSSRPLCRR
mmetsp:Transcript_20318/g.64920  ORF Transcript_20318/g.64920 Transcript_20318/m.64920 type:complete len:105 (+) Transcript_20318:536-850(+)